MILESLGDRQDGGLFVYSKGPKIELLILTRRACKVTPSYNNLLISVLEIVLQAVKDGCCSCREEFESMSLKGKD